MPSNDTLVQTINADGHCKNGACSTTLSLGSLDYVVSIYNFGRSNVVTFPTEIGK